MKPDVSIVIPAYNEQDYIAGTVSSLLEDSWAGELLVVDDGSADDTSTVAWGSGAKVIRLPKNRGKGYAMRAGWEKASGNIIVFLDADLGASAREAKRLVEPILADQADMTVAVFERRSWKGGLGLVVRVARWGIWMSTGRWMKEPLSGQRAIRRPVLLDIPPLASGFGVEVGLTIDALRKGWRVEEVPTAMTHRLTGRDPASIRHRARQGADVCRAFLGRIL